MNKKLRAILIAYILLTLFIPKIIFSQITDLEREKTIDFDSSKLIKNEDEPVKLKLKAETQKQDIADTQQDEKNENSEENSTTKESTGIEEDNEVSDEFLGKLNIILVFFVSALVFIFIIVRLILYFKKKKI